MTTIGSQLGTIYFAHFDAYQGYKRTGNSYASHGWEYRNHEAYGLKSQFLFERRSTSLNVSVPHWLPAIVFALLGSILWLPFHFSLRTLLIATTFVAVGLALIARYLHRGRETRPANHRNSSNRKTMRPRFSLKRLLTVVTALAIALFVWVLYPTAKAKQCVAAINDGRSNPYQLVDRPTGSAAFLDYEEATTKKITAELLKRSWSDILHGQRRFVATLTWYADGSKYDRQHVVVLRATPLGYQLERWQEMSVPHRKKADKG